MRILPAALILLLAAGPLAAAEAGPNILLVTVDTLRADHLGCYGSTSVRTPAADALAARGTLFTRAFAHNPLTLPSHANILLGLTPNAHGVHDNSCFIVREDFLDGLYQLGLTYLALGRNPEAIGPFEDYLKIDAGSERAGQVKGFLEFLKKK